VLGHVATAAHTTARALRHGLHSRRHAYTYGEYLVVETDVPTVRHQFIDGEIIAMAGGSELHSALSAVVAGELYA
jgi:hypothetical protein